MTKYDKFIVPHLLLLRQLFKGTLWYSCSIEWVYLSILEDKEEGEQFIMYLYGISKEKWTSLGFK